VWRATVEVDRKKIQLYLVLDRGVVKLVGATDALSGVGRYILRGGDAKADSRARTLLDWIRADNDKATWPDMVLFKRLWGPGTPSSRDAIRLAAAHLAGATDPDRVIAVAAPCASTLPDAELACHKALFLGYRARGRWPETVAQSEAILALEPSSAADRVQIHAWALSRAGRFEDADRALDGVLAKDPDHQGARIGRFEVAAIRGSLAEVIQRGDAATNHPAATAEDINYVAWYRLGMGGDLTPALELARKAVDKAPRSYGSVNTLAAIEAERGELDGAIRDNWKAMALRNSADPEGGDWYVVGRIEEQLGLAADAAAAYKRVTKPKFDQLLSIYTLAQRRLAALGAAH
jgi:tetratricopeptide (TPR) repeat protein